MESPIEEKILEQVDNWCGHCQAQVVRHLQWSADLGLLTEITKSSLDAIYHRSNKDAYLGIYENTSPNYLKEIRNAINEILENRSKNDPFSD